MLIYDKLSVHLNHHAQSKQPLTTDSDWTICGNTNSRSVSSRTVLRFNVTVRAIIQFQISAWLIRTTEINLRHSTIPAADGLLALGVRHPPEMALNCEHGNAPMSSPIKKISRKFQVITNRQSVS